MAFIWGVRNTSKGDPPKFKLLTSAIPEILQNWVDHPSRCWFVIYFVNFFEQFWPNFVFTFHKNNMIKRDRKLLKTKYFYSDQNVLVKNCWIQQAKLSSGWQVKPNWACYYSFSFFSLLSSVFFYQKSLRRYFSGQNVKIIQRLSNQ